MSCTCLSVAITFSPFNFHKKKDFHVQFCAFTCKINNHPSTIVLIHHQVATISALQSPLSAAFGRGDMPIILVRVCYVDLSLALNTCSKQQPVLAAHLFWALLV